MSDKDTYSQTDTYAYLIYIYAVKYDFHIGKTSSWFFLTEHVLTLARVQVGSKCL